MGGLPFDCQPVLESDLVDCRRFPPRRVIALVLMQRSRQLSIQDHRLELRDRLPPVVRRLHLAVLVDDHHAAVLVRKDPGGAHRGLVHPVVGVGLLPATWPT